MSEPMEPTRFNPRGGDHRSSPGRFGPLAPDDPSGGKVCIVCGSLMLAGDIPSLISLAPADEHEARTHAANKPYNAVAGIAHQSCTWPGEART